MQHLSEKLTALRKLKKVTLQQVADSIGISKTHIWQLERGITTNPTMDLIIKLSEFFAVRPQTFIDDEYPIKEMRNDALVVNYNQLNKKNKELIDTMLHTLLTQQGVKFYEQMED